METTMAAGLFDEILKNAYDPDRKKHLLLVKTLQGLYWSSYCSGGGIEEFEAKTGLIIGRILDRDTSSGDIIGGKRQPDFRESYEATMDRLRSLETFVSRVRTSVAGVILGGSLSYGAFFNVRKGEGDSGSDVDVIVLLDVHSVRHWKVSLNAFIERVGGLFDGRDVDVFRKRKDCFIRYMRTKRTEVFSQKLRVRVKEYDFSLHFFSLDLFDQLFGSGFQKMIGTFENRVTNVRDFKSGRFPHPFLRQNNFSGQSVFYIIPPRETVEGGNVTLLPAYSFYRGKFYPGIYANLISPCFQVWHDTGAKVGALVEKFRLGMLGQMESERGDRTRSLIRSHPRYSLFRSLFEEEE